MADRLGATGLFLTQAAVGVLSVARGARAAVLVPFGSMAAGATACLHHARTTDSFEGFERGQAAWHLLSVAAVVFGARKLPH